MTKLVVKNYRFSLLYYDKVTLTYLIKLVVKKYRFSFLYYDKGSRKEISLLITVLRRIIVSHYSTTIKLVVKKYCYS